jgi:hypothetical protein
MNDRPSTPVAAMVGTEAGLAVEVSGTTPSYQWYKDAVTPGNAAAARPGANRSTLWFDPLQRDVELLAGLAVTVQG